MSILLEAILAESEPATITRSAPGTWERGIYYPGATSTFGIVASIQSASDREADQLPEGIRQRALQVVYCEDELLATDPRTGRVGDTYERNGDTWEIVDTQPWAVHGGYHRSIAARQER